MRYIGCTSGENKVILLAGDFPNWTVHHHCHPHLLRGTLLSEKVARFVVPRQLYRLVLSPSCICPSPIHPPHQRRLRLRTIRDCIGTGENTEFKNGKQR